MAIVLGENQYGKAENRVVRVERQTPRHQIRDVNVSSALRGDFHDAHVTGDQAEVLPTDTQKNTVFAFAREHGIGEIEDFALMLGDHFVRQAPAATGAKIEIDEYTWDRIDIDGKEHAHSFVRSTPEVRNTVVTIDGTGSDARSWVISGLKGLVVAKTTGSEFQGFLTDRYTTLAETDDRILATSLTARWRYLGTGVEWGKTYGSVRSLLLRQFAEVHSKALQQSLYDMGKAVLEHHPDIAEIRFSAPNKHHFLSDLTPFGLDNPGEVFFAADRPYGLIEATVRRDDVPDADIAWRAVPGFC
ncbi:factor-independent urate hydroxylase [Haloechinothrix sp. LS1_15]|uniref:factor-independent urate hydroxylase n=1 Tax=Haloechinothrix sp. LS1_15 TaxID=2652248 RepID=UPI0029459281|nr:urate oxidase [Haloechinothrix sp. LS1_15]MDV6012838.1 urate oxidase [Haloechinothrix sp. LS1_15]